MNFYIGHVFDRKLKNRWRGEVRRLGSGAPPLGEVVAVVYGKTIEEMRKRKRAVVELFRQSYGS
jgi:hypothetical protein